MFGWTGEQCIVQKRERDCAFSFEVLPPLKGSGIEKIFANVEKLLEFDPQYVNITTHRKEVLYRELPDGRFERVSQKKRPGTVAIAAAIHNKYNVRVVPHILCSGFSKEETEYVLIDLQFLGITDLFLLRGDKAKDEMSFRAAKDGYAHAIELEKQVCEFNAGRFLDGSENRSLREPFTFGVACYPEKHEEAPNLDRDIYWLKQKVDGGATYAVTQMFFDNRHYFDFVRRAREAGITVPIIPGIRPLTRQGQLVLLPQTFRTELPQALVEEVMRCKNDDEVREVGIRWCIGQSRELREKGVDRIHYYTYGAEDAIRRVCREVF
ncbi:MAG: methylenetetrahydrofolate reductase [NAD(P)H] [Paludibacteraceae bacterium]|nr:methylenetetrahydrofolate reductase [NAD(P)H] [Paludibacteraceae bacterium]